jgi:hypothetical protein
MLAAAELDRADNMPAPVQRHLVPGLRQRIEDEAPGRNERAALIRAVDATHWTVVHGVSDHAGGREGPRMPGRTLAGRSAPALRVFPDSAHGHTPTT